MKVAGDGSLGLSFSYPCPNIIGMGIEPAQLGSRTLRPAQPHALGLLPGQRLAGTRGNELPLNRGRYPEGKSQHLSLDSIAQPIPFLDGPNSAPLLQTGVQNIDNHEKTAPQTRQFGTDNQISHPYPAQQLPQLTFIGRRRSRNCFTNPPINGQLVLLTELKDLIALVLQRLPVGGDTDLPINHIELLLKVSRHLAIITQQ